MQENLTTTKRQRICPYIRNKGKRSAELGMQKGICSIKRVVKFVKFYNMYNSLVSKYGLSAQHLHVAFALLHDCL